MAINTHKGLFMYTRLFFGIASLPGVFQRMIYQLIQGIPKTVTYPDDILISGKTMEEHNSNLRTMLKRLQDAELRLSGDECEFKNRRFHTWAIGLIPKGPTKLKRKSMQFAKVNLQRFHELQSPLYKQYQLCSGPIARSITKRNSLEMGTRRSLCRWGIKEVARVN